ncbi:Kinetochoreassociated protein 1like, partial [Caligus rogercresseyi]
MFRSSSSLLLVFLRLSFRVSLKIMVWSPNFGTRFAFESQEKLFDVVTQATIHADSHSEPFLWRRPLLSLGSSLHLLRGSSAEDESISYLSCSPCGHFLVLGLPRDCRFLHLPTGTLIPPINLDSLNSDIIYANWGEKRLHLVTGDSQLVSIHGLDWSLLHTALLASDMEALQDLQRDILIGSRFPSQDPSKEHSKSTAYSTARTPSPKHFVYLKYKSPESVPLRRIPMCSSSWTRSPGRSTCSPLEDMVLLEESSEEAELQLILITRRGSLQIRGFPSFELIYELKVHDFSRLMQTCSNQETPYFLEGSEKGTDFCLRVRGIVEASPDA